MGTILLHKSEEIERLVSCRLVLNLRIVLTVWLRLTVDWSASDSIGNEFY